MLASRSTVQLGLAALVGPVSKRIGLAALTLESCQLTHTSHHLHLSLLGAWTHALMYRRPLLSVLQRAYGLVDSTAVTPSAPADELVVLSALCHLVACDVSAPWQGEIYASDSAEFAGAFVSAKVPAEVAQSCGVHATGPKPKL